MLQKSSQTPNPSYLIDRDVLCEEALSEAQDIFLVLLADGAHGGSLESTVIGEITKMLEPDVSGIEWLKKTLTAEAILDLYIEKSRLAPSDEVNNMEIRLVVLIRQKEELLGNNWYSVTDIYQWVDPMADAWWVIERIRKLTHAAASA